jgi:hypothetical protein
MGTEPRDQRGVARAAARPVRWRRTISAERPSALLWEGVSDLILVVGLGVYVADDGIGSALDLGDIVGARVDEVAERVTVVEGEEPGAVGGLEDDGMAALAPVGGEGDAAAGARVLAEEMGDVLGRESGLIAECEEDAVEVGRQGLDADADGGEHAAVGVRVLDDETVGAAQGAADGLAIRSGYHDDSLHPRALDGSDDAAEDGGAAEGQKELGGAEATGAAGGEDDGAYTVRRVSGHPGSPARGAPG